MKFWAVCKGQIVRYLEVSFDVVSFVEVSLVVVFVLEVGCPASHNYL